MDIILLLVMAVIRCLLNALQICMLVRAILSWIPGFDGGALGDFVYTVTEPLISVVRIVVLKIRPLRDMPFDMSFFFAYLIISILLMFI